MVLLPDNSCCADKCASFDLTKYELPGSHYDVPAQVGDRCDPRIILKDDAGFLCRS